VRFAIASPPGSLLENIAIASWGNADKMLEVDPVVMLFIHASAEYRRA
jgi:hypothetical protein